jgi:putative transposase
MRRRWTADEITRLLKEADRDLAKGLTASDICRKYGISSSMYYRWRKDRDPDKLDTDRRCRELELEVDRLKKLVAELLLDKQMLQDIAKKSGEPRPASSSRRLLERAVRDLATADLSCDGAVAFGTAVSSQASGR